MYDRRSSVEDLFLTAAFHKRFRVTPGNGSIFVLVPDVSGLIRQAKFHTLAYDDSCLYWEEKSQLMYFTM